MLSLRSQTKYNFKEVDKNSKIKIKIKKNKRSKNRGSQAGKEN